MRTTPNQNNYIDPKVIALQFNQCINNRDLKGLLKLMADEHVFIDTANKQIKGKANCRLVWETFFKTFPDYKNNFETVRSTNDIVTIEGNSVCSDKRLHGPALWTVKTNDSKVLEWRVYEYTPENRASLGISAPDKLITISVMLAVEDAPKALEWYKKALGATELWNLGPVVGLEVEGAAFFLGQPENNGWESPTKIGTTSTRIEVFSNDPDAFIARAVEAGAQGSIDKIKNHEALWGIHRQGGFFDPFGHRWLVGDKSPLKRYPG